MRLLFTLMPPAPPSMPRRRCHCRRRCRAAVAHDACHGYAMPLRAQRCDGARARCAQERALCAFYDMMICERYALRARYAAQRALRAREARRAYDMMLRALIRLCAQRAPCRCYARSMARYDVCGALCARRAMLRALRAMMPRLMR